MISVVDLFQTWHIGLHLTSTSSNVLYLEFYYQGPFYSKSQSFHEAYTGPMSNSITYLMFNAYLTSEIYYSMSLHGGK